MRWRPIVRILSAIILLVGCSGGASKKTRSPEEAQREAADAHLDAAAARRKALHAARPKEPFETRERIAFRPGDRCGQGPYRMETDALRAKYGEQIIVYACGQHEIAGNYRLTVEYKDKRRPADSDDRAFGWGRSDNAACKANRASTVQAASGTGSGTGAGAGAPPAAGGGGAPAAPPAKLKPTPLARVAAVPEQCRFRSAVLDSSYRSYGDSVPLDAHLVIDLWSDEPNDLEGLVFVIEKKAVVADMTVERWKAYMDASRAWGERYMAFLNGEVAAGRTTLVDTTARTPPPPPARAETPPPRPSRNARWIPGYWHHAEAKFHWIAGLWQVPDEDIAKDLTVHAPKPPPAAPVVEPRPARPTGTAVWTSGQWQWDGRAYVWIAGSWRIPPTQQHAWKSAGWSVGARGAIFVPGGWRVRIGR
jgi:hypothetical protein